MVSYEVEYEEQEEEPFIPLKWSDWLPYPITDKQEEVIREYATREGFKDLRGFHFHLRREQMNYYDILRQKYF